jgi:hypothetical protein
MNRKIYNRYRDTLCMYRCAPYPPIQYPRFQFSAAHLGPKKNEKLNKWFVSFRTPIKRKRVVTWWNPAAQTRPLLYTPSFVPVLTLPRRTCLNSASSVLTVRISFRVIAVFVFRKPLFINYTLPYLRLLHEYHVAYSVRYYPRFHVTAVGFGTYCP